MTDEELEVLSLTPNTQVIWVVYSNVILSIIRDKILPYKPYGSSATSISAQQATMRDRTIAFLLVFYPQFFPLRGIGRDVRFCLFMLVLA